jgi:hypothetical protein
VDSAGSSAAKKGEKMKRNVLFLISILTAGLLISTGCGERDEIEYDRINELWEQQIVQIDIYVGNMEKVKSAEEAAAAIDTFTRNLDEIIPRFNGLFEKYPAFKVKVEKERAEQGELTSETLKNEEAMAKLIAVGLFTETIVNMGMRKFKDRPVVVEARQRLIEIQKKMKLDDSFKKNVEAGVQYGKLVEGQMTGSPKVEKFFKKLRRASLTSRLKITMRNIFLLGRAIEVFKTDYTYAPKVTELDQLKTYADFVPKYIKALPLEDGWGNYLYYKAEGANYWIGSAGSDGNFRGFAQKGFYTDFEGNDVIYSNGGFICAPNLKGVKRPGGGS